MDIYTLPVIALSVSLNLATLTYLLANRLFGRRVQSHTDQSLLRRKESESLNPGKTIVNLVFSVLLPLSGFALFLTTTISEDPFNSYSDSCDVTFALLASSYVVTMAIALFAGSMNRQDFHVILHHIVALAVLVGVVITQENAVLGLIGLFMTGDGLTRTLIDITEVLPRFKHTMAFRIVLCLHLLFVLVFRVTFPVMLSAVPLVYSWDTLSSMSPSSQCVYWVAMAFFGVYNCWLVCKIAKRLLKDMRSTSKTGVEHVNCEEGTANKACLDQIEVLPPQQKLSRIQHYVKIQRKCPLKVNAGCIRVKRNASMSREPLCHTQQHCDSDHVFFPAVSPKSAKVLLNYSHPSIDEGDNEPNTHSFI